MYYEVCIVRWEEHCIRSWLKLRPATMSVPEQVAHLLKLSVLSCTRAMTNCIGGLLSGSNVLMSVDLLGQLSPRDGIEFYLYDSVMTLLNSVYNLAIMMLAPPQK